LHRGTYYIEKVRNSRNIQGQEKMSERKHEVSMSLFIAGLVVAILASSALSTIIATQFVSARFSLMLQFW